MTQTCALKNGVDLYVTAFGKTLRRGFFVKIKFDVCLISSNIELFAKTEADRALRLGASALCLRSRHTHRKYGLKVAITDLQISPIFTRNIS